ncbi:DNA methylase [Haloferax tailed virus 1]|uniref:DNA methylase n=1 Tax=Haloferax tailed virus 1 TaxID=2507575 RepID=A0A410N6Y5_HFTV1|nr:DNA methyltransferase [Haloferax tailed virus 1]QAS68893.1 DNA methylase [Haloferax tailed virus 1]
MSDYNVLDLFAGLGGFSAAFEESERWDVTTVEIEEKFDPDIVADVFDLRPSDFEQEFDVVLASPPCTQFSPMAWSHEKQFERDGTPVTQEAAQSVALVYHTLGLIKSIAPSFWFMENPRGAMRWVIGEPTATIDYCAYGHYTKKPTDFWGEHPPMTYKRCPHEIHTDENGVTDMERGPSDPSERAKLPYGVSNTVLEACESALDGNAPKDTTLTEWHE